jgi:hypothetical protein
MRIVIKILLLLIYSQVFSQVHPKSDSLELWTLFTTGDFVNDNANKIASKNWPFKYISKAGDCFTDELADSLKLHNNYLWKTLTNSGYINPEENYNSEFTAERERIMTCVEIVTKDSIFRQLKKRLIEETRMDYTQLIKVSETVYLFEVSSFFLNGSSERFEKSFTVNLKTKTVINEKAKLPPTPG